MSSENFYDTHQMVLYDKDHCDPVVLTQRLAILNQVRDNLARHGCTTSMMDAAIEHVEELLGEHLPPLPRKRWL